VTLVVIILLLLLANALFVAAEFAVIGAPKTALEHQARQGDSFAKRLLAILTSPVKQDRYIATAQVGITLASLGLGMYAEHTLAERIEPWLAAIGVGGALPVHGTASVVAIAALTYLHIFVGEMVPKAVALSHAERTARIVYLPMQIVFYVLYPFVLGLNSIGNLCLRVLGVRRQEAMREDLYTPDELRIIVEESQEGGVLGAASGWLLQELFEFSDRTAGQAMVPRVRVAGIPMGASPADLRRIVRQSRHTRYPVYEGDLDHIVGMLHVKDVLRRLIADEPISASDCRPMPVVPETAALDDLLGTMQKAHAHLAIVIDEHGGTAGIVSLEDLFEEVVGEIDEGVPSTPSISQEADGVVLAVGTVRLDELGQYFGVDLEHDEVESVSGLVLERLGRPPIVGDVVDYDRLRLEVTEVSGKGVKAVRVRTRAGEDS
jgi:CBS domain containing-hemolysin-like protein